MDNCPQCGALYALVGRVHNCRPRAVAAAISPDPTPEFVTGAREFLAAAQRATETYKYRDPIKRRAQVAKAMRDYRARKRANG